MKRRDWAITCPSDPAFRVLLGDCTREHAESVLVQLLADELTHPRGLVLQPAEGRRSLYRWRRRES